MTLHMMPSLSIVIPAYCSASSLPILVERLEVVLKKLDSEYEIIIVDDCSPDNTWEILKDIKSTRQRVKIISLRRNSGQHNAILCGFTFAKGDVIVTMDDDLQNPPEEVPKLLSAISEGYDLAIGAYDSKKHSLIRNLGGYLIDVIQRRIFKLPNSFQLTSFRAVRKPVVDHVLMMAGLSPYITSMLLSHTSRYVNVPVLHEPRAFGQSNYNLSRSLRLALNLLLNYSSYPLYFVVALCIAALGISISLTLAIVWRVVVYGSSVPGWASTITVDAFFNSLILLGMVIQGLYLSRLSQQLSRSRVGFSIGEIHE